MKNWREELRKEIMQVFNDSECTYRLEDVDGIERPMLSAQCFDRVAGNIVEHLVNTYGFSYINPDTVQELDALRTHIDTLSKIIDEEIGKLKQEWSEINDKEFKAKLTKSIADKHYARGLKAGITKFLNWLTNFKTNL